jgi:hypothetical protein
LVGAGGAHVVGGAGERKAVGGSESQQGERWGERGGPAADDINGKSRAVVPVALSAADPAAA